ncbi:MAG: dihydroorotase [Flavobacteriaceae bacterium]|nr:dihydroorotase [Flavobacteriaceae bacterium]NNK71489.1 dihydroorotase [Flavobacteriaceae bacterium]
MNILIKSAKIVDPKSEHNNETRDILVEKDRITKISSRISNPGNYKEIRLPNLHVSPGWFDSSVCFGQPGYEERETIKNGLKTAAISGFTAVGLNSNTKPVASTGSDISFLLSQSQGSAVKLLPIGALSEDSEGNNLSEMYDMLQAGAVAFYDYQKSISDPNFAKIALQYSSSFDALICLFPFDKSVSESGVMHEGFYSTSLGLNGIPSMAEFLRVQRDLSLLEYTDGKLHIPTISTRESVQSIREAKSKGLDVSCSVAIHNLLFTDETLKHFDSNCKVLPPLREDNDREALIAGLKDGTIDMVTSDHNPLDIELKKLEFDHAEFGTIGLETAFGALNSVLPIKTTVKVLTRGKTRFGQDNSTINVGEIIDATLFDPSENYVFEKSMILSKSKNSLFMGKKLKGRVYGIISNGKSEIRN